MCLSFEFLSCTNRHSSHSTTTDKQWLKSGKAPTSWSSWHATWRRTILRVNYIYYLHKYKVTCRAKGTLPADPCCENLQSSSWNPKQLCTLQVQPRGVVETSFRDSCFPVLPFQGKNKSEEPQQVTCNVKSAHYTESSTTIILYAQ